MATIRTFGLDRILAAMVAAFLIVPAWTGWPNGSPGPVFRGFAALAGAFAVASAVGGIRGSAVGFTLLWGAFGMTLGLSIVGLLALLPFYPAAAVLLIFAIVAAPNRTAASRVEMPYLVVQVVGFFVVLAPLVVA